MSQNSADTVPFPTPIDFDKEYPSVVYQAGVAVAILSRIHERLMGRYIPIDKMFLGLLQSDFLQGYIDLRNKAMQVKADAKKNPELIKLRYEIGSLDYALRYGWVDSRALTDLEVGALMHGYFSNIADSKRRWIEWRKKNPKPEAQWPVIPEDTPRSFEEY